MNFYTALLSREIGDSRPLKQCVEDLRVDNLRHRELKQSSTLKANLGCISNFAIQGWLCASCSDGEIRLWDWQARNCIETFTHADEDYFSLENELLSIVGQKIIQSLTTPKNARVVRLIDLQTKSTQLLETFNEQAAILVHLAGSRLFALLENDLLSEWDCNGKHVHEYNLKQLFPPPPAAAVQISMPLRSKHLLSSNQFFVYLKSPRMYCLDLLKNRWKHIDFPQKLKIKRITAAFLNNQNLYLGVIRQKKNLRLRTNLVIFDLDRAEYKSLPFNFAKSSTNTSLSIKEVKQQGKFIFVRIKRRIWALDTENAIISRLGKCRCPKSEDSMQILNERLLVIKKFSATACSRFKIVDTRTGKIMTEIMLLAAKETRPLQVTYQEGQLIFNQGKTLAFLDYNP